MKSNIPVGEKTLERSVFTSAWAVSKSIEEPSGALAVSPLFTTLAGGAAAADFPIALAGTSAMLSELAASAALEPMASLF